MIRSMTGYAALIRDLPHGVVSVELKTVNSRFLDIGFRMAEELRPAEPALRELISARVARGKVECRATLQPPAHMPSGIAPNLNVLRQLREWQECVLRELPKAQTLSVADVLRWPGVLGDDSAKGETLQAELAAMVRVALDEMVASRAREGEKLASMIRERTARISELVATVAPRMPALIVEYQEKLAARLREALASQDEERIRQETGLFAARIDVAEELSRLRTHVAEVERVLDTGGTVGKRLDFLMQELNREANTLASKSVSAEVSGIALELKLLIEQMREQVQNIE